MKVPFITTCIREKKLYEAVRIFFSIHDYGYSVIDILDYFVNFIKQTDVMSEDEKYNSIPIIIITLTLKIYSVYYFNSLAILGLAFLNIVF